MRTMIQIQEEYIETVNAGVARWSHTKTGGHSSRISTGARRKALAALRALGFTEPQANRVIDDARDMARLIRNADEE